MKLFYIGATMLIAWASFGPASAEVMGTCKAHYQNYLKGTGPKAFASTGTLAQVKTTTAVDCGVVLQWSSKAQAINKALELCNNARKTSRRATPCRILDSKDKAGAQPAPAKPPKLQKSEINAPDKVALNKVPAKPVAVNVPDKVVAIKSPDKSAPATVNVPADNVAAITPPEKAVANKIPVQLAMNSAPLPSLANSISALSGSCGADIVKFYLNEKGHKAVATEGGEQPGRHLACGFSSRYTIKTAAIARALDICARNLPQSADASRACKIYQSE